MTLSLRFGVILLTSAVLIWLSLALSRPKPCGRCSIARAVSLAIKHQNAAH